MISIRKQRSMAFSWITIVTLISFVWTFTLVTPVQVAAALVKIPAGTIVNVAPVSAITPELFTVGDPVQLTVVSDVSVNGKVVIAAGAEALSNA